MKNNKKYKFFSITLQFILNFNIQNIFIIIPLLLSFIFAFHAQESKEIIIFFNYYFAFIALFLLEK